MVGLNSDARKSLPSSFQEPENHIILIGETNMDFGGSLYIKELFGETVGEIPELDYKKEFKLWKFVI